MGCSSSMQNKKKLLRSDVSINLTDDQKNIIKKTWITIEENRTKIGKQTFIRVFELNPQIKKKMPEFMTADPIEELNSSKKLFGHSKTLMTCLENAVKSLDDNERFVAYLVELGRRHKVRPLKAPHLEVIHEALMFSFKEVFQSEWTTETSNSWSALFRYMSEAMIIGLNDT